MFINRRFKVKMKKIIPLFLIIILLASTVGAQTDLNEKITYDYEFTQKYVVAGERVLNIEFHNESEYHIEALEFEVLLKNPFGDEISDWNSFMNPEFELESGEKGSLRLSLTKRNIMGVEVGNVLDDASDIKLVFNYILHYSTTLITTISPKR